MEQKRKTLKEASIIELKAECFDINEQIKMLQRKNQEVVNELQLRYSEIQKQNNVTSNNQKGGVTTKEIKNLNVNVKAEGVDKVVGVKIGDKEDGVNKD